MGDYLGNNSISWDAGGYNLLTSLNRETGNNFLLEFVWSSSPGSWGAKRWVERWRPRGPENREGSLQTSELSQRKPGLGCNLWDSLLPWLQGVPDEFGNYIYFSFCEIWRVANEKSMFHSPSGKQFPWKEASLSVSFYFSWILQDSVFGHLFIEAAGTGGWLKGKVVWHQMCMCG